MFGVKAQSNAPTHSHIPQRHTHTLHFHSYCPKHNLIGWDRLTAGQMFQRRHTWEVRTCVLSFQHVWILTPWTGELSQPVLQTDPTESTRSRLSEGQDEENSHTSQPSKITSVACRFPKQSCCFWCDAVFLFKQQTHIKRDDGLLSNQPCFCVNISCFLMERKYCLQIKSIELWTVREFLLLFINN